ncbi:hypothetical protein ABW19_dt0201335 [Dactylella cylindrospora]|nr:hypothetical protein ABW19_dt0201335 [Dactylella cylindrospora]
MRISFLVPTVLSGLGLVAAQFGSSDEYEYTGEELLFHYYFTGQEDYVAEGGPYYDPFPFNFTTRVVYEDQWNAMTTDDFKKYKAIIIGDPIETDPDYLDYIMGNRQTWGAAVSGNVIIIGTDTSNHYSNARELMSNGIAFAASGSGGTGLYFSLSKYYGDMNKTTVEILDIFGTFEVRGDLNAEELENCYDEVHIVARNEVLDGITDTVLSNWSCSVHEAFVTYPSTGDESFVPLAIAQGVPGEGARDFSDGSNGIPYILVRGASPIGCGNGVLDPGEECDDGNTENGDGCNYACRFEPSSKPAAGVIAGGVVGAVVGVAALGGLGYLAVTKTGLVGKAGAALGMTSAAGAGGGGTSGAAGAASAMYVPTGVEGKAAAAFGADAATHGAAHATQAMSAVPPPDPSAALGTQAASSAVPPPVDPASAMGTQAASSAVPPPVDPSTGLTAASAPPPPAGYVPGSEGLASQVGGAGAATTASTAGTGFATGGSMATGATTASTAGAGFAGAGGMATGTAAATGGGLSAPTATGAALAAGSGGGLTAFLFGAGFRKKKQNQQAPPEYMPAPPMAPVPQQAYPQQNYVPQQYYNYTPPANVNYAPPPQPPQPEIYHPQPQQYQQQQPLYSGVYDDKTGASSQGDGLGVGVQEVTPTPQQEQANPMQDQPYIPPPPAPQAPQAPPAWRQDQP